MAGLAWPRSLRCQGGSAIGLSATDALAEPQPVMDDNSHSPVRVPQTRRIAANIAKLPGLLGKRD
jgi:hypothetical protein